MKQKLLTHIILPYRRLPARQKAVFWGSLLLIALVVFPSFLGITPGTRVLRKADMYFLTPQVQQTVGQTFAIELRVKTNGTPINAVGSSVRFNPQYLEIVNMTTEKSFCSFYLENSFDNIKGEVKIFCGLESPGFQGDSVVVRLNVRGKIPGSSQITVDEQEAQILANDGKGSNILQKAPNITIPITDFF